MKKLFMAFFLLTFISSQAQIKLNLNKAVDLVKKVTDTKEKTNQKEANSKEIVMGNTGDVQWNKFDFIPGDIVIFEDNLVGEKNGEFPSQWDLTKGTVENASMDGENVIYFISCNTNSGGGIVPLMKNNKEDYLPEEFTVELDVYFEKPNVSYKLNFLDYKNQKNLDKEVQDVNKWIRFSQNSVDGKGVSTNWYPGTKSSTKSAPGWRHISVSFNKRALKVYLDDCRIINIPNIEYNPTGITLGFHNPSGGVKGYVKNIRIAQGAVPLYDKVITDGKIVTTGIKFDINKAIIKPESYGTINSILKILQDSPDLKFRIEGHTDSDGDDSANLILSEARAEAIMDKLVELGIEKSRLDYKGLGETKPISPNTTYEGKANNRRVEFIKF
ncbi:MAG: OmpA family protein [bacterium]